MEVTARASQREIAELRGATMRPGDRVFDMERRPLERFVHLAVLAPMLGATLYMLANVLVETH